MSKFFTLLAIALLPFSLSAMEKEDLWSNSSEWSKINESLPINEKLHSACALYGGNPKKINDLLEAGADPNAYSHGYTPLGQLAKRLEAAVKTQNNHIWWNPELNSFEGAVKSLLRHGADLNKINVTSFYDGKNYINARKTNRKLLEPYLLLLDHIIKTVDDEKRKIEDARVKAASNKKHLDDLKKVHEKNANRSINIENVAFKFNEEILSTRCPSLCLALNPDYKKEAHPQFYKPLLQTPLCIRNSNIHKIAALNFEQIDQEID